jgi:hypothetical protein
MLLAIFAFIYNLITGELWEAARNVVAISEKHRYESMHEVDNTQGKFKLENLNRVFLLIITFAIMIGTILILIIFYGYCYTIVERSYQNLKEKIGENTPSYSPVIVEEIEELA